MSNVDILKNIARIVPSAKRSYDSLMTITDIPEWRRENMVKNMLDEKIPEYAPSGMGYMAVSGMDEAQKTYDQKQQELQSMEASNPTDQALQNLKENPQEMGLMGKIGMSILPSGFSATGPNVLQRIGTDIAQRGENLNETMKQAKEGKISNFQQGRSAFTELTGGVGDVSGEVLKTASGILPKFISEGIGLVARDLKVPEAAEIISNNYNAWAEKHPEAAANLAAIGNLGRAAVNTYGVQALGNTTVKDVKLAKKGVQEFFNPKNPANQPLAYGEKLGFKRPTPDEGKMVEVRTADNSNIVTTKDGKLVRYVDDNQMQRMIKDGELRPSPFGPGTRNPGGKEGVIAFDTGDKYGKMIAKTNSKGGLHKIVIDAKDVQNLHLDQNGFPVTNKAIPLNKIALAGSEGTKIPELLPENTIRRLIQPKRTKAELQELYRKDPSLIQKTKGGVLKSSPGPSSTGEEIRLADDLKRIAPELSDVKNPIDAGPIISEKISQKGAAVDDALKNNPFALPKKESLSKVYKSVMSSADDFGESRGIFEAEYNRFKRYREAAAGTGFGEREALKAYDFDTNSRFGSSIYEKGTARAEAIRAVREASHATLEGAAQRAGFAYLPEIKDMSSLYKALDNIATHVDPSVFNSFIKQAFKNPIVKAGAEAIGISTGLKLLR